MKSTMSVPAYAPWRRYRRSVAGCALVAFMVSVLGACACARMMENSVKVRAATAGVYMLPELRGGVAGWCITDRPGKGCPVLQISQAGVVAENWSSEQRLRHDSPVRTQGFVLTSPDVTSVSIDGEGPVATHRERELPDDLRAVSVGVEGLPSKTLKEPLLRLFPRRPIPTIKLSSSPKIVPLGRHGQPVIRLGQAPVPAFVEEPGRSWVNRNLNSWAFAQFKPSEALI